MMHLQLKQTFFNFMDWEAYWWGWHGCSSPGTKVLHAQTNPLSYGDTPTKGCELLAFFRSGLRRDQEGASVGSSVVSSSPYIHHLLRPEVQTPGTPSKLFSWFVWSILLFIFWICHWNGNRKLENYRNLTEIGQIFFQKNLQKGN